MLKTVQVPDKYKFIIDRAFYEISMRTSNLAFMLHRNLDNPDFLDSELCKRLEDELVDSLLNRWIVFEAIYNEAGAPSDSRISRNFITGRYSIAWFTDEDTTEHGCSGCGKNKC